MVVNVYIFKREKKQESVDLFTRVLRNVYHNILLKAVKDCL